MKRAHAIIAALSVLLLGIAPVEFEGYTIEWSGVNWEGGVDVRSGQSQWEATLTGKLTGPAERAIVGYVVEIDAARDSDGRSLLPTELQKRWHNPRRQRREDRVQRVLGRRSPDGQLGNLSVTLGGSDAPAKRIAVVKGTLYVMEVVTAVELDVPLAADSERWVEKEGIRFRVDSIENRGQQSTVILRHTLSEESAAAEDLSSPPYPIAVEPLDELNRPMPVHMANFNPAGSGTLSVTLFARDAPPHAQPGALRIVIATEVRERQIPFELADLELGLGNATDTK